MQHSEPFNVAQWQAATDATALLNLPVELAQDNGALVSEQPASPVASLADAPSSSAGAALSPHCLSPSHAPQSWLPS